MVEGLFRDGSTGRGGVRTPPVTGFRFVTVKDDLYNSLRTVFGRPWWAGRILVGGFLLTIPVVGIRALGMVAGDDGEDADAAGFWRTGWARGAGAAVIFGADLGVAAVLTWWVHLLLGLTRIFSLLAPVVGILLFAAAVITALSGVAALRRGESLAAAADPVAAWDRLRRDPARHAVALLIPCATVLVGFWVLPQALFLGLWISTILLSRPASAAS